jgi:uncharacterized repeat protein (TIGR03803 family)
MSNFSVQNPARAAFPAAVIALALGAPAGAQDAAPETESAHHHYALVYSFTGKGNFQHPEGALMRASDGNFYGTTTSDAVTGIVFRMTPEGAVTPLATISGRLAAPLVEGPDGNLYGVADGAGDQERGIAFRVSKTGTFTVLHRFKGGADEGKHPWGALILASDGNFYGTTNEGGRQGVGTVYRMTPEGQVALLLSFDPHGRRFTGYYPETALTQGMDGHLYGTTSFSIGGKGCDPGGCGGLFKLSLDGRLTWGRLLDFKDGAWPTGALFQASDGRLYGEARRGGAVHSWCYDGCGTIFRITPKGEFTGVRRFGADGEDGPLGGLNQASDGFLYGVSLGDMGRVFRMSLHGTFTTLHTFSGRPDGDTPTAYPVEGPEGVLFGTTYWGGVDNIGAIYRLQKTAAVSGE